MFRVLTKSVIRNPRTGVYKNMVASFGSHHDSNHTPYHLISDIPKEDPRMQPVDTEYLKKIAALKHKIRTRRFLSSEDVKFKNTLGPYDLYAEEVARDIPNIREMTKGQFFLTVQNAHLDDIFTRHNARYFLFFFTIMAYILFGNSLPDYNDELVKGMSQTDIQAKQMMKSFTLLEAKCFLFGRIIKTLPQEQQDALFKAAYNVHPSIFEEQQ